MIEGLQPYAEYKESNIPWARALPSNWQTERAKRLFTKMQRPVRPEDEVVTCFRDGRVTLRRNRRLRGFTEATVESGYQGIRKGDLVIHGMDAFAGAIGVSDSDGKSTPVYNVCKPNPGIVAGYYAHTVREMSRALWILALAKGIRERSTDFRYETFGNQFVPLPPPDEQAAIVRFLEHANRKIDGFIRVKRKLIALLGEQKQAIIHRAVTRGVNPDTPLKASGIPWLGDIPRHWEISRVKNEVKCLNPQRVPLSSTQRGTMTERTYDYYGASGVIDKVEDFIFDDELLLIAEDGANLVLRNLPLAIIAKGQFWVNNHAHILKPKRGNLAYLAGYMETLNYQPWISGAAQPKLTKDRLMGIAIADYYRTTILSKETDPNKLHILKGELDGYQVYSPEQIDRLVELYLGGADRDKLDPILDACVAVYVNDLDEDGQVDFKGKAKAFARTYDFLATILPYGVQEWEKLSIFLNFLIPKLPAPKEEDLAKGILEAIDMDSYRAEKKATLAIALPDADAEIEPVPTSGGGRKPEPEMDKLSNIIKAFNDQFGGLFNDPKAVEKRIMEVIPPKVSADPAYQNARQNSDRQNARIEHDKALKRVITAMFKDDAQLFKQFQDNDSFRRWLTDTMFGMTYEE